MDEHYHRCASCNLRMTAPCTDRACREGIEYVVMCIECWDRLRGSR